MTNFRRTLRTTAAVGAVGALFVLFCVVAVDRERRTAEREGLVASRFVPATLGNVVGKTGKNGRNGASVFVPFESPRAQTAADRAVVEFLRTTERRADSPEASGLRRARIFEARRRFATSDVAEERRLRRVDDARTAAEAVDTLRVWTETPDGGEFDDILVFDDALSVDSSLSCADSGKNGRSLNGSNDFDGVFDVFDPDLAAATAFLAELSDEPSASSVPLAPLAALDAPGDFRDAVVFLDANSLAPVPVAVETVVGDAAPRTLAVVGVFQTAFALFATFGARFFCVVDWARFFSIWNVRRRGNVASAAPSTRLLILFERWGATRTLADLAVVRLLN